MSQAGILKATGGGGGGGTVNTLTGNSGGAVGPDGGGNINVLGGTGINIVGNPGANTLTASLSNSNTATTTTVGAVTSDIITIALGATPATYIFEARIAAFNSATPAGAGFQIIGMVRTTGAAATLIGQEKVVNQENALLATDANLVVSANNAIFRVLGEVALTVDWAALSEYTKAT